MKQSGCIHLLEKFWEPQWPWMHWGDLHKFLNFCTPWHPQLHLYLPDTEGSAPNTLFLALLTVWRCHPLPQRMQAAGWCCCRMLSRDQPQRKEGSGSAQPLSASFGCGKPGEWAGVSPADPVQTPQEFSQHNPKQGETYRVAHLSCLEAALSFRKIVPLVTSPHLSFPPSSCYHLFTHPGVLF